MANQNKELLRYVENNEEQLETEEVKGNTKDFLNQVEKGIKLYGVYIDKHKRVYKDHETYSAVLETVDGMIILPDHQRLREKFEGVDIGDLVIVSCTDIKYDKNEDPCFYDWKVERVNTQKLQPNK